MYPDCVEHHGTILHNSMLFRKLRKLGIDKDAAAEE
jgi:hypothetical protein